MNNNIKVLLYSVIIGVFFTIYVISIPKPCNGFVGLSQGIDLLGLEILISIVFGVLGLVLNKPDTSLGKRFIRGVSWFGISLVVIFIIIWIGVEWTESASMAEWNKKCLQPRLYDNPNYKAN